MRKRSMPDVPGKAHDIEFEDTADNIPGNAGELKWRT